VEGEVAVARLLASGLAVESVLGTATRLGRLRCPPHVATYAVEEDLLLSITGVALHRGCVALARRPARAALAIPAGPISTVVVAERIADPVNVGALLRNARAFGADLVVLDAEGADPYSPRAVRASMGLVFGQALAVVDDVQAAVAALAAPRAGDARPLVLAAVADPAAPRLGPAFARPSHLVLLVGNEGDGLSAALRSRAGAEVTIAIDPTVDSLNVAAATAILLHALRGPAGPVA
jgi:tRNA G18 (ribose-2'-O)-methylase SpoU